MSNLTGVESSQALSRVQFLLVLYYVCSERTFFARLELLMAHRNCKGYRNTNIYSAMLNQHSWFTCRWIISQDLKVQIQSDMSAIAVKWEHLQYTLHAFIPKNNNRHSVPFIYLFTHRRSAGHRAIWYSFSCSRTLWLIERSTTQQLMADLLRQLSYRAGSKTVHFLSVHCSTHRMK